MFSKELVSLITRYHATIQMTRVNQHYRIAFSELLFNDDERIYINQRHLNAVFLRFLSTFETVGYKILHSRSPIYHWTWLERAWHIRDLPSFTYQYVYDSIGLTIQVPLCYYTYCPDIRKCNGQFVFTSEHTREHTCERQLQALVS